MELFTSLIQIINFATDGPENLGLDERKLMAYNAISFGSIATDKALAKLLFDQSEESHSYQKFKSQFKAELIKIINRIEFPKGSDVQQVYFRVMDYCSAVKKLATIGKSQEAYEVLKTVYHLAMNHGFYVEALSLSKFKYWYTNLLIDDKKLAERTYQENLLIQDIVKEEIKSERYLSDIIKMQRKKTLTNKSLSRVAENLLNDLNTDIDMSGSFRFNQYRYMIKAMKYELEGRYHKSIQVIHEAIEHFTNLYLEHKSIINMFRRQEMSILIHCKDYDKALKLLSGLSPHTGNRFTYDRNKEFEYLLNLRLKNYGKADDLCDEMLSGSRLKHETQRRKDKWDLFSLYMDLLVPGRLSPKILTKLKGYRDDKKGMNIPVLIAEILYYHHTGNDEIIYHKVRMLKRYIRVHLDKTEDKRSIVMLKMLMELPKRKYVTDKFLKRTGALLRDLKQTPVNLTTQSIHIEIIPYEDLWAELLKGRVRRKTA